MNSNEVTVQQLNDIYKNNKTASEREVFLKTTKLLNPDLALKLEKYLLREQILGLPFNQLITLVAEQKGIHIAEAETLLRDHIFENMLDQSLLVLNTDAIDSTGAAPMPPASTSAPAPTHIVPVPTRPSPVTPQPARPAPVRPPNRPVSAPAQRPPGAIPPSPRIIKPLPIIQIGGEVPEPVYTPESTVPTPTPEHTSEPTEPIAESEPVVESEQPEQAEVPKKRTFFPPKGVQSE